MAVDDEDLYPVRAPGWAAIDGALSIAHPGQTPHQFTSKTAYDLGGTSPLPAISVYAGDRPAHWHYVTYGLTELFEKSSPREDVSGFGFELTFKLPRAPDEAQPPVWPLQLLQGIGGYLLEHGGAFDAGHVVDLDGPIVPTSASGPPVTALEGVVAVPDPSLGKRSTPHGSVLFLLLFGLTRTELEAMRSWELARIVGLVRTVAPLGITRTERSALSEDPATQVAFRRYALGVLTTDL
jgi:hypothetical protein